MLSSFSIIKNSNVLDSGEREIVTKFQTAIEKEKEKENQESESNNENNIKENMESYEMLVRTMLENARTKSEAILNQAYAEAEKIKNDIKINEEQIYKDAYEKGYSEGLTEGNKNGYHDAYEVNMAKVTEESKVILNNADETLKKALQEYKDYFENKREEIKEIIIAVSEKILKRELMNEEAVNDMVFDILSEIKNAKAFIIRCNELYCGTIKNNIGKWKSELAFNGEIFVIADASIELGNVVIDRGNGKILVGIDVGLQKIKEIIQGM